MRPSSLFEPWHAAFIDVVRNPGVGQPLREASLAADLKAWTTSLTAAVVQSCEMMGWRAAGRKHKLDLLPQPGQEYLSLDVMGFDPDGSHGRWPMPTAVFELENHRTDDRVAYSLWKVLCVKAQLRIVFAYRLDWQSSRSSVAAIGQDVVGSLSPEQLYDLHGETVMIFGNRGEGDTFPDGFFKCWRLDTNQGRFEKI